MTVFDYVAFFAMTVVFVAGVWLVIWLGDMPARIAKERNHPQVPAVTAMSWFGLLFTGGVVWIFAMVWAFYDYSAAGASVSTTALETEIESLRERLGAIESRLPQTGEGS